MKKTLILLSVMAVVAACSKDKDNASAPGQAPVTPAGAQGMNEVSYMEMKKAFATEIKLGRKIPWIGQLVLNHSFSGVSTSVNQNNNSVVAGFDLEFQLQDRLKMYASHGSVLAEGIVCKNIETIKSEFAIARPKSRFYIGMWNGVRGLNAQLKSFMIVSHSSQKLISCEDGTEGKGFVRTTELIVPGLEINPVPRVNIKTEIIIDNNVVETIEILAKELPL